MTEQFWYGFVGGLAAIVVVKLMGLACNVIIGIARELGRRDAQKEIANG